MKTISSIFVLFAIVAGLVPIIPAAFADHTEVTIVPAPGSGTPGCEKTAEGCNIPKKVTVDVGGKVVFSNTDTSAHTFTAGNAAEGPSGVFDTGLVIVGSSYEWTATTVGEYPYFCQVHPWMVGEVIVQEAMAEEEEEHEELTVMVDSELVLGGTQINLEFDQLHVNYEITAKQNGEIVFQETAHAMEMTASHMVDVEASEENPLEIEIISLGVGAPGAKQDWTGPFDEVVATQHVVPEFGTIAMMILGISIVSIIAVTAKTRVIPRF
ncbi:MAG: PEFG-CTERM sorting domain-containing protein [Nitrosopumilaceae archaeon]